jgi:hypothetical protein
MTRVLLFAIGAALMTLATWAYLTHRRNDGCIARPDDYESSGYADSDDGYPPYFV